MLTAAELVQMTLEVRGDLASEELESLGHDLGHLVVWKTSAYGPDEHRGWLDCPCGWHAETNAASSRRVVQEHLEGVVGERFDADGRER